MNLIQKAIQKELYNQSDFPEINWQNVYFYGLDLLEEQIEIDSLPEDLYMLPKHILDEQIQKAKHSMWVAKVLEDTRYDWQQRQEDPYKKFGVEREFFI